MTVGKSMRVLRSNHQLPRWTGRWVLIPRKPPDEPVRSEILARRRRMFCVLLAGTCLTLAAGILPGAGFLAWAGVVQAVVLAVFVVFLLSEKKAQAARPLHLPTRTTVLYLVGDPVPAGDEDHAPGWGSPESRWNKRAGWNLDRRRA